MERCAPWARSESRWVFHVKRIKASGRSANGQGMFHVKLGHRMGALGAFRDVALDLGGGLTREK